jgi:hypothetical protein
MKYKTEIICNKEYEIEGQITIKSPSITRAYPDLHTFDMLKGTYRLIATYKNSSLKEITLFLPEYISYSFSNSTRIQSSKLMYTDVLISTDRIKKPVEYETRELSIHPDGFTITKSELYIYPTYHFDKVVGIYFETW